MAELEWWLTGSISIFGNSLTYFGKIWPLNPPSLVSKNCAFCSELFGLKWTPPPFPNPENSSSFPSKTAMKFFGQNPLPFWKISEKSSRMELWIVPNINYLWQLQAFLVLKPPQLCNFAYVVSQCKFQPLFPIETFNTLCQLNIARGTTDPGYCLFNLSYLCS